MLTNEDSTQIICARIREKYNIYGVSVENVTPYVKKDVSKSKLSGKINIPKFTLFDKQLFHKAPAEYLYRIKESIGFPIFIKPIDLVSSIGTYFIPNEEVLLSVLYDISKEEIDFEIDEYIEGNLFHCDFIVCNNDIKFFSACKYANPLAQFSKGSPMGSIPVGNEELQSNLYHFSKSVLKILGSFLLLFTLKCFKKAMAN